eukprot:gnl/MRDRNA2_/MRDRNA2_128122_c0_seq1.p1 gnl/MRDRNA2_/MRDRNA2_128122_c0~~gnl/MRDRNA2_/MRDRNA2_128122_c0_seq1.p1  ORF type:complete len:711 (-),score=215.78 gnl/MRDRNA2_/MRDRNA2_128122_c0_seq1:88-2220(-)
MKCFLFVIPSFLVCRAATSGSAAGSPVEKVVQLIEELKANLEHDQKVEQKMYDKYACWCANSAGRKAETIKDLIVKQVALTQSTLELKAKVAILSKEISDESALIAENQETQKKSTAVRQKENGEWMASKADLEEAINALTRAIKVLSGAGTKTSLLQVGNEASTAVRRQMVGTVLLALPAGANVDPKQFAAIQSFAEDLKSEVDASAAYAPQSATVQGILKDMYDTFTAELEGKTQAEAANQRAYEDLMSSLTTELNNKNAVVTKKEEEKASAMQELAGTVQELDDVTAQKDADIEFFDQMKAGCLAKSEEWNARKAARKEELEGMNKALEILTSDKARALFGKAIKPGMETMLFQLDTDSSAKLAAKAYNVLKFQARQSHSLRIASLAASLRSSGAGHFDLVIKEIDKIIQELKDEEAADIKQRDWCKDEYQENSEEKAETKWLIQRNKAMITKLENTIEALVEELMQTETEIATTNDQIKSMEDTRKETHEDFLAAKKDDEMAIKLLTKTVEVLSSYYKKEKIEMGPIQGSMKLLQEPEFSISKDQAPDATFSDKGKRKNESKGILSILTMIIEDLQAEIKNGIQNEISTQAEFEKQLAAAKKLVEDLTVQKENLKSDKAKVQEKEVKEEDDKAMNEKDLKANEEYLQGPNGIKPDCDWMLNSFDERREKRKGEMNGLVTAKEYLTGAAPPAMVQTPFRSMDDTNNE